MTALNIRLSELDVWLRQATRSLAQDAAIQVRAEILEHYQSAHDVAIAGGASPNEADRLALKALGDARTTNRQYRRVLLTSFEASMLRDFNREARAICSRPWLKVLLLTLPAAIVAMAAALFLSGRTAIARDLLAMGLGMSPILMAPLLPVYTPARGRVYRWVKWLALAGALAFVLTPATPNLSWLYFPLLWTVVSKEWTRAEIRRKLPVETWPKHLYL